MIAVKKSVDDSRTLCSVRSSEIVASNKYLFRVCLNLLPVSNAKDASGGWNEVQLEHFFSFLNSDDALGDEIGLHLLPGASSSRVTLLEPCT